MNFKIREEGSGVSPGDRIDDLEVLGWQFRLRYQNGYSFFAVMCMCLKCEHVTVTKVKLLNNGKKRSCGCAKIVHGECGTRLYKIWGDMVSRCRNQNHSAYKYYRGRGINVCEEWLDYGTFSSWARGNGYEDHLTIDRRDNSKGYDPENCRWATRKQQSRNTRSNRKLTCDGVTKTVSEWVECTGIDSKTIRDRIDRGWTVEEAIKTKPGDPRWKD